jgi:hypothetical protein
MKSLIPKSGRLQGGDTLRCTDISRAASRDRRDVWKAEMLRWCDFEGEFEMPAIPACNTVPTRLTAFSDAKKCNGDDSFIHFFQDDYKYERVWEKPKRYLSLIKAYKGAIAPDFSLYREMPLVEQMHNVFKSRSIAYWWAKKGVTVIPNVRWGDKRTFDFCFDGLPKDSVVAVGTHGSIKRTDDKSYFFDGLMEMLDRIEPRKIVVYGSLGNKLFLPLFFSNIEIIQFESDFSYSHSRKAV